MDITGKVDDLIDVSAEDDSLLTSPATNNHEKFEFNQSPATSLRAPVPSVSPKSKKECGESKEQLVMHKDVINCQEDKQNIMTNPAIEGGYPPLCEEDLQPKRKKRAAQFNLRKSLAWDQAFFTSEGVLNPVELSLLNKTFNKSNETLLSSIEEEDSVRSSMDSNSTLSGDILALETFEENLFTESHTSNASSFGTVHAQSKLLPLPNTRVLATQQKNIATNLPKSPERKSSHGAQDSSTFKRFSSKVTEELQKPSQLDDASGKNCASAPTIATKKVPTGHKRIKYSQGNAVPVNGTKATMHRNTPSKAKENLGTGGRSVTSLNSSTSELCGSTKHLTSSLTVEIPVPSGTTDLSNNKILPKTSELVSSTVSTDLTSSNSEPLVAGHNVHEHFRPKIGSGVSTDSALSHCGKQNQGLQKGSAVGVPPLKSGSTATARSNMTLTAKDPTNCKQNHGLEKGKVADLPIKSISTSAARTSMIFSSKDPPSKSGCPRPVNLQSKPTGLRMPTPKHGFFDTEKVIRAPHPAVQKRSSTNHFLPPKSIPKGPSGIPQGSKLKPPGVPLPRNPGYRGTVPSAISMATHLRPESALTGSIASIPAPLPQSQLKADIEGSGLGLLALQKFGLSPRGQQGSLDQRNDQIQLSSDAYNAAVQSSLSQVDHSQKSTCSDVSEEEQSQLSFVHEKHNLQDVSHMCSEQENANANGTVIPSLLDTGKASDMKDISCLQPHYQYGTAVVADATTIAASEPLQSERLLYSNHEDGAELSEEVMFKSAAKEISTTGSPLDVNSGLMNSLDHGTFQKHVNGQKNSVDSDKTLTLSAVPSPILDDIAEKENMLGHEEQTMDSDPGINSRRKLVDDMNIQVQNIKNLEAPPFSEEWLRAMEAAGEELLQMKSGRVQHSPPDKIVPEPGPWSPVRRHSQQIGPFDCTKYTNAPGTSGDCQDQ